MAELKCLVALQFAVMGPALLVSAVIKSVNDQRVYVRQMQDFFEKIRTDRQFCKQLITYQDDGVPASFLSKAELKSVSPKGLSEGHALAYKSVCQPSAYDEIVIDMMQICAAHLAKTQLNMSADLILEEAKQDLSYVPGDNIAAERVFGFVSFRRRLAWNENHLRTNGLIMYHMNNVSEWLREKGEEERARLITAVSETKFRRAVLRRQKIADDAVEHYKKERQAMWYEKGQQKLQEKAAVLAGQDVWGADEVEELCKDIGGKSDKQKEACRQVWQHLKAWATKAKLKFPYPKQPSGGLVVWKAALRTLLEDEYTAKILVFKEKCRAAGPQARVNTATHIQELEVEVIEQDQVTAWCEEVIEKRKKNRSNNRSTKHRQDAEAAQAEKDAANEPVEDDHEEEVEDDEEEEGYHDPGDLFDWSAAADGEALSEVVF